MAAPLPPPRPGHLPQGSLGAQLLLALPDHGQDSRHSCPAARWDVGWGLGGGPLGPRWAGPACPSPDPPQQTSCLQYLDARNTPLLDHSAPFVARALRIRSSLAVLHLENASLSGRPLMLLGELWDPGRQRSDMLPAGAGAQPVTTLLPHPPPQPRH